MQVLFFFMWRNFWNIKPDLPLGNSKTALSVWLSILYSISACLLIGHNYYCSVLWSIEVPLMRENLKLPLLFLQWLEKFNKRSKKLESFLILLCENILFHLLKQKRLKATLTKMWSSPTVVKRKKKSRLGWLFFFLMLLNI